MVLSTIFIVVILANVVLTLITSQSRLTHHQVSRIQAYYAAQAGMNYAIEMLRLGDANWIPSPDAPPTTRVRTLCRGCTPPDVDEPDLPGSVQSVTITVEAANTGINGTRRISANANYIYTP